MLRVVVGGPWYRGQVDVRLMVTMVRLCVYAPDIGAHVVRVSHDDGMVDVTRNRLMERAIQSGAEWFLSLDADCSLAEPLHALQAMKQARAQDVALVGFPARENSGRWNVVTVDDKRIETLPDGNLEVARVGFGAVAFRLGWYVKNWPRELPYCHTMPVRDRNGQWASVGEDFGHCDQVRRLGGRVLVDGRVVVDHHMGRAGAVEVTP